MSADYLSIARRIPHRIPHRAEGHAPAQKAQKAHEGGLCALNALFAHPDLASAIRDWYEERAAIRQYEAGYRRDMAERLAYCEALERWCDAHPMTLAAGTCAGCGAPLGPAVLKLPDGAHVHWERHREFACLVAYGFIRKRRSAEALAAIGLVPPKGWGT